MIPYSKSFIGVSLLFRIHGSPLFRAVIPGLISVGSFLVLELKDWPTKEDGDLKAPYGVGVLISSISLLIVFRANSGYQRYWNACGDVHQCMSKWLDATVHTAVFHMQQDHYDPIKPPNYYEHHDLNRYNLIRDREEEGGTEDQNGSRTMAQSGVRRRRKVKSIEHVTPPTTNRSQSFKADSNELSNAIPYASSDTESNLIMRSMSIEGFELTMNPRHLLSEGKPDGGWGGLFNDNTSTFHNINGGDASWEKGREKGFASTHGGRTPSLFLQELAHLASLMNAVAFCTLRNDVEGAESPLGHHFAGSDFPPANPDKLPKDIRKEMKMGFFRYMLGMDRTPEARTEYNALRPMPVIGGVSDNEIMFLQRAKGPSAKVTLAWHWLSEFIIREYLAGSLGDVGGPMISRLIQFLSDGMIYYNHARKTMYIPFPFPHAQISAFFVVVVMFCIPLLMDEYTGNLYLGAVLTFLTVTCLAGLHEVARELENPFRNVPNEIPLCTLQAMFNESLITMYSGYHPDHYWDSNDYLSKKNKAQNDEKDNEKNEKDKSPSPSPSSPPPQSPPPSLLAVVQEQQKSITELQKLISLQSEQISKLTSVMMIPGESHSNCKNVLKEVKNDVNLYESLNYR